MNTSAQDKLFFFVSRGPVPSKKNSRINFVNKYTGKQTSIPNKKYYEWEKRNRVLCRSLYGFNRKPILKCEKVELDFFFHDFRRRDLTNAAESIMDMLVSAQVISDDCWKITGAIILTPYFDKQNPRCEISIYKSKNTEVLL